MKIKIPMQIIDLEQENFHLIVSSTFQNGKIGNWVIDTGASKTVFDKNKIENYTTLNEETEEMHSAGITEKPLDTTIGILEPFSFKILKVQKLKVALLDLSHINYLYLKSTNLEICGLLGGDFFMKYKAIIDYKKEKLILTV